MPYTGHLLYTTYEKNIAQGFETARVRSFLLKFILLFTHSLNDELKVQAQKTPTINIQLRFKKLDIEERRLNLN
tara:strand:+ start:6957 stop:7178 length:222 start_codon:yes stop_codon:yes gene_type:complete